MKSQTFALLTLLSISALSFHLTEATAKSGESEEQKSRRDTCDSLVQEPPGSHPKSGEATPPTPGPTVVPAPPPGQCYCSPSTPAPGSGNFESECTLVEAFYNMSVLLTKSERVLWEEWIVEIENTILANASLTSEQEVVLISLSLKEFFSIHVDIYDILAFQEIADWGFVIDFCYVSVDIQLEITQSVVTLDGNGQCELTECLLNASANGSPQQSACNSLVAQIQVVLEDVSLTYEEQLGMCYQLFQAFFVKYPSMESWVLSLEISGYGSIQAFLDVCKVYEQIDTISVVLSGSSNTSCVLLQALQAASKNSSFTKAEQTQILQLETKLAAFFTLNISLSARLEYVSYTCYQMFLLEPWMISIVDSIECGNWGTIYDIIFCSGICTNYGCGNIDSETTTQRPSTAKPIIPHNCATIGSLIVVSQPQNTTILTTVLTNAYNTWNATQKAGFNTYFNLVRGAIWNNKTYPTQTSKLTECRTALMSYNNNSAKQQQLVMNLTISVWQGTVAQFVACCP